CCEACVQFAPGRLYHFYAGKQQYNYRNRHLGMNLAKYTNVAQYHMYLCDRCAARAWQSRCGVCVAVGMVPALLLFPVALLIVVVNLYAGLGCLLVATLPAGLGALYSAYSGWRLAMGARSRDDRERVAIQLMRPKYRRTCDCFWTTR